MYVHMFSGIYIIVLYNYLEHLQSPHHCVMNHVTYVLVLCYKMINCLCNYDYISVIYSLLYNSDQCRFTDRD